MIRVIMMDFRMVLIFWGLLGLFIKSVHRNSQLKVLNIENLFFKSVLINFPCLTVHFLSVKVMEKLLLILVFHVISCFMTVHVICMTITKFCENLIISLLNIGMLPYCCHFKNNHQNG